MRSSTTDSVSYPDSADVFCRIGARGVSRSFGPVRANIEVDLVVSPGTVHAVVGENGAGKSTLMRMLYGLDQPDSGSILVDDKVVKLSSPRAAIERRIGLVQQELAIIPELTLLENLVLGEERARLGRIDWKAALAQARNLSTKVNVEIDWHAEASRVSIAIQQQVEILRLVYRGADVLILDEPTAALAPAQADELFALMRSLRDAGRTLIFISHKLDEVVAVADAITVLRSGRTIAEMKRGEIDRDGLAAMIIGDSDPVESTSERGEPGAVVIDVQDLNASDDRGIHRLAGVGFEVRSGEILGVAAVAGNGQEELAEVLVGIRRASSGILTMNGTPLDGMTIRARRQAGVSYVSADRKHEGLALQLSLAHNAVAMPLLSSLSLIGWLRPKAVAAHVKAVLERAAVRFGTSADPASSLSGGNQQRVVLGRETIGNPRVLIASQPTRGVDVRGISFIHLLIRRARNGGAAVVLFSEELDELIELSDRIIVLHGGHVVGELPGASTRAEVGALMLGQSREGTVT